MFTSGTQWLKLGGKVKKDAPKSDAISDETLNNYFATVGEINAEKIQRAHRAKDGKKNN